MTDLDDFLAATDDKTKETKFLESALEQAEKKGKKLEFLYYLITTSAFISNPDNIPFQKIIRLALIQCGITTRKSKRK